jgi:hypothetical protein
MYEYRSKKKTQVSYDISNFREIKNFNNCLDFLTNRNNYLKLIKFSFANKFFFNNLY